MRLLNISRHLLTVLLVQTDLISRLDIIENKSWTWLIKYHPTTPILLCLPKHKKKQHAYQNHFILIHQTSKFRYLPSSPPTYIKQSEELIKTIRNIKMFPSYKWVYLIVLSSDGTLAMLEIFANVLIWTMLEDDKSILTNLRSKDFGHISWTKSDPMF